MVLYSSAASFLVNSESKRFILGVKDTSTPVPTYTKCCDGSVNDGKVTDFPNDNSIRSNLSTIVFESTWSFNYEFKCDAIIPGKTRTAKWSLKVLDPLQDARAGITFSDTCGNDTTIQIDYHSPKNFVRPQYVDFGLLKTGETRTLDFWMVNYSNQSEEIIKALRLRRGNSGFIINLKYYPPFRILQIDSIKFSITFNATNEGTFEDSIGIGNDCIFNFTSKIKAEVGYPVIVTTDISYDSVEVGKVDVKDFFIKNEGNVPLVIIGFDGPNQGIFTTNLPFINQQNFLIVKPKEIKIFEIQFKPKKEGNFKDSIVFTNDAGTNKKNVCYLQGTSFTKNLNSLNLEIGNQNNFIIAPNPATDYLEITYSPTINRRVNPTVDYQDIVINDVFGKKIPPSLTSSATPQE